MTCYVFFAIFTAKYGVSCKNKTFLWFHAKNAPTYGVTCNFLPRASCPSSRSTAARLSEVARAAARGGGCQNFGDLGYLGKSKVNPKSGQKCKIL
jgi:hypothetical protein